MTLAWQFVWPIVSGLLVAVVTSFLTARLAFRRFYSERWWERKAEAYTALIEALYQILDYPSSLLDEELGEREVSEDRKEELSAQSERANRAVTKAMIVGALVLSPRTVEILKEFRKGKYRADGARSYFDLLDEHAHTAATAINAVVEEAARDLMLDRSLIGGMRVSAHGEKKPS